jgi:hypothetical protein
MISKPLFLVCGLLAAVRSASAAPSFLNDVLPILSKANCNGGGCHGALAGKAGFRLSLFAYNPEADYLTITRESRGRRVDLAEPAMSLLLTKPTTALPHKGGKKLEVGSADYNLLAEWIAAGAPNSSPDERKLVAVIVSPPESRLEPGKTQQLTVTAKYSDNTERDVTKWAKFTSADETLASVSTNGLVNVNGHGQGAITVWFSSKVSTARLVSPYQHPVTDAVYAAESTSNLIDAEVISQLQKLKLKPSPLANDNAFIRRAYLDVIGRLPSVEEVNRFVAEPMAGKYDRLADHLLNRPEFTDYWTYKWADVLLVNGSKLRPVAVEAYYKWIWERVAQNMPWDQLVREVVTSKGGSLENGATNFFAVHQEPEAMAENVSQAFLSLSINCAKCHNHPLEKWTNDQYYGFASLFSRVRSKGWGGETRNGDGIRSTYVVADGELIQPRTGKPQAPAPLDAAALDPHAEGDRREVLAQWLTAPENPYFTRAIVNRVWANYLGIGLVESVDDLRVSNPASNEQLLSKLAEYLAKEKFNLKSLMRLILTSHTYRRSTTTLPENAEDKRYYSRHMPRRLMAEVLSDAISDVTQVRDTYKEIANNDGSTQPVKYADNTRALQLSDSAVKSYFLKTFGRNSRDITCECERSNQPSLVQVLHLSNGDTINDKLAAKSSRVSMALATGEPPDKLVEQAWMVCLSRGPTEQEKKEFIAQLTAAKDDAEKRVLLEDMYWSLLTSREFLFQH